MSQSSSPVKFKVRKTQKEDICQGKVLKSIKSTSTEFSNCSSKSIKKLLNFQCEVFI